MSASGKGIIRPGNSLCKFETGSSIALTRRAQEEMGFEENYRGHLGRIYGSRSNDFVGCDNG